MSTVDRVREVLGHYLTLSPVVTRRTMLARERNAFQLGVDYGTHVAREVGEPARHEAHQR